MMTVFSSARAAPAAASVALSAAANIQYLDMNLSPPAQLFFHRLVPTLSLSRAQAKDRPWAYGRSAFAGRAVELGQDTVGERAIIVRLRWRCAQAEFADRLLPAD